jgi:hypothetical protein
MHVGAETSRILWFLISTLAAVVIAIAGFQFNSLNVQLRETENALNLKSERIVVLEQNAKALDVRMTSMERDSYQLRYGNR